MKKITWIWIAALVATLAPGAFAGEGHKKCDENAENCLNAMVEKTRGYGWLGIETEKTDYGKYRVTKVVEGSPAATYGLQQGDILVALNGIELSEENKDKLKAVKEELGPGVKAKYTVKRSGGKTQVAVTLGTVPAEVMAEWIGRHMIDHHAQAQVASK